MHKAITLINGIYKPHLITSKAKPNITSNEWKHQSWLQKELHGRHAFDLIQPTVDPKTSNSWPSYGNIFPETEGFMLAIQDQVIETNNNYKKL